VHLRLFLSQVLVSLTLISTGAVHYIVEEYGACVVVRPVSPNPHMLGRRLLDRLAASCAAADSVAPLP